MLLQMAALWKVISFVFVCSGYPCVLTHQCSSRSVCSTIQDSLLLYWALTLALSAEQSAVEWHRKSIWYLKSHIERELLNDYAQQSFAWEVEPYRPVTPQASWEDLFFIQIFFKTNHASIYRTYCEPISRHKVFFFYCRLFCILSASLRLLTNLSAHCTTVCMHVHTF